MEELHRCTHDTPRVLEDSKDVPNALVASQSPRGAGQVFYLVLKERGIVERVRSYVVELRLKESTFFTNVLDRFNDSDERVKMPATSTSGQDDAHRSILSPHGPFS